MTPLVVPPLPEPKLVGISDGGSAPLRSRLMVSLPPTPQTFTFCMSTKFSVLAPLVIVWAFQFTPMVSAELVPK